MWKLIFSWIFLSFCISQIWAMQELDYDSVAIRLTGNHEEGRGLIRWLQLPYKDFEEKFEWVRLIENNPHDSNQRVILSMDHRVRILQNQPNPFFICKEFKKVHGGYWGVGVATFNCHDANELASVAHRRVAIWEINTERPINIQEKVEDICWRIAFNPNNNDELGVVCGKKTRVWNLTKLRAMQKRFESMRNGVLPITMFKQKNSADKEREIKVDPKVLLLLMHKLNIAKKYNHKMQLEKRGDLTQERLKYLAYEKANVEPEDIKWLDEARITREQADSLVKGRVILTPQELAYLTKVVFESSDDAREVVKDLVAVAKKHQK